jgi:hypothetical protein
MVGNGLRSIRAEWEETERKTHLVVLERCPFDGYKSVHGKRLGMFGHTMGYPVRGHAETFTKTWSALGSLPDETNTISIRLTEPKDSA